MARYGRVARGRSGPGTWRLSALAVALALAAAGCSPVTRHQILSTIFDGVPSLPPPEQVCEDYAEGRIAALGGSDGEPVADAPAASQHAPYVEKKCTECHDFTKEVGLVRPERELCFLCHRDFVRGAFVHGPVAVGQCLACHLPHRAPYTALLVEDRTRICAKCHKEERLAAAMHDRVVDHDMSCVDCHDPHFGESEYFLR